MDEPRSCGCKGCRTCLLCEQYYGIAGKSFALQENNKTYVYCPLCNRAWSGWNRDDWKQHPNHSGESIEYSGVYIDIDFLQLEEECALIKGIDSLPWDLSQSGRRKQNYGPKCNFKRRKLRLGDFQGFPKFSQFVQQKFKNVRILKDFQTIEQCSLEYDPTRGASIDPHIDDCWIWGERIITVNLLSDSVLTMSCNSKPLKYNLDCVEDYPAILNEHGKFNITNSCYKLQEIDAMKIVRIPMPRRSLLVMYGSARYDWEHQILREDIEKRRVCLAYREFTPPYLNYECNDSKLILDKALEFWNTADV